MVEIEIEIDFHWRDNLDDNEQHEQFDSLSDLA
jgi:hypothetical protein